MRGCQEKRENGGEMKKKKSRLMEKNVPLI
jgi:hypothetical protein